jgi:hypothetical protein
VLRVDADGLEVLHGSQVGDSRTQIDGMTASYYNNTGNYLDDAIFQEMTYQSGGTAEAEGSGVVANMIPKDGGNMFSGVGASHVREFVSLHLELQPEFEATRAL